jgi:hypothetical protein
MMFQYFYINCPPIGETKFKAIAPRLVAQRSWQGIICLCILGSNLSVHACHPRGALPAYWACRVFSGSGD